VKPASKYSLDHVELAYDNKWYIVIAKDKPQGQHFWWNREEVEEERAKEKEKVDQEFAMEDTDSDDSDFCP